MTLKNELSLINDFLSIEHESIMGIYYTASLMKRVGDKFFSQFGLTDVQFNLLVILLDQSGDECGLSQVDLSKMMLVNRANITSLIDRMEQKGLVLRENSIFDRRIKIVKPTKVGMKKIKEADGLYMKEVARVTKGLSREDLKGLNSILSKIRNNLKEEV